MIEVHINADDFGASENVNEAIDRCFGMMWIDRTTIMTNMPGFEQAVQLANKNGYSEKVGLHLNLIEGSPLTEEIKKTDFCTDGVLNGKTLRIRGNRLFLNKAMRTAVQAEVEAQMKAYIQAGFSLMHLDSHEHTHTSWSILRIVLSSARKYGFKSIRLSRNIPEKEICGVKKFYKALINSLIMHHNRKHSIAIDNFFGSQKDITKSFNVDGIAEMMIHPIMTDGRVADAYNKETIGEWLAEYNGKFNRFSI